jgi:hypothetical protein
VCICVCLGVCAFVIVSLSGRCVYVCARARTHARASPQSAKVEENTKESVYMRNFSLRLVRDADDGVTSVLPANQRPYYLHVSPNG